MSQNQQTQWGQFTHKQKVSYLESFLNNEILFSTKLLGDYLHQLKILDQEKKADTIKAIEEAIKDRIIALRKELNKIIEFIPNENPLQKKQSFLKETTDFGMMEPGVE